jgi:excisionase family DNA binding protein
MVMMTVNNYAKRMAASASQIRQMCADGILPSVKIGKGYKIDVERADLYFSMKIDERLNEARKKEERRVIRTHKQKANSTFVEKLKALKKKATSVKEVAEGV